MAGPAPAALTHPLTLALPDAPAALSPAGAGVGGDNDTVWATGCRAESGLAAVYGAVARYVFDVGNWDNCSWIVVSGASGDPASPHYADQHQAWSRCELIPMRYDWDRDHRHTPATHAPPRRRHVTLHNNVAPPDAVAPPSGPVLHWPLATAARVRSISGLKELMPLVAARLSLRPGAR